MSGRSRAKDLFDRFVASGDRTIEEFIAQEVSEQLFMDYKRSANNGDDSRLHPSDRENLARAISGFGNSEGGIIVWGVECRNDPTRGDVPSNKHPLKNVKRFASLLEGATSGCTLPPHDTALHHIIEQGGTVDGFVVTYVPKSMWAPHQCIVGKHKDRYFIRVGSNFEMAPHGLLAGMFGRQPTPDIYVMWGCGGSISPDTWAAVISPLPAKTPYVWCNIIIRNGGITVARDLYANLTMHLPGPNCVGHCPRIEKGWIFQQSFEWVWHVISEEGYRLAPAAMVTPITYQVYLDPPFDQPLSWELSFGCAGSPVHRLVMTVSASEIERALKAFLAGGRGKPAGFEFAREVLGLRASQEFSDSVEP